MPKHSEICNEFIKLSPICFTNFSTNISRFEQLKKKTKIKLKCYVFWIRFSLMPHDISTKFAIVISQRIKVLSWSKKQCKEPNKKKRKRKLLKTNLLNRFHLKIKALTLRPVGTLGVVGFVPTNFWWKFYENSFSKYCFSNQPSEQLNFLLLCFRCEKFNFNCMDKKIGVGGRSQNRVGEQKILDLDGLSLFAFTYRISLNKVLGH